jgi:translation initiation factor 2 beta subunit (eIF-2beta)/eIF-5
VEYVLRFWTCEKCSRANKTDVARDGTVTCEQCAALANVRNMHRRKVSRVRGPLPQA